MVDVFLDAHPRLGVPTQIAWHPSTDGTTSYEIDFTRPLNDDDISAVRNFVTQHGNIAGAERHPLKPNSVVVGCRIEDSGHSLLRWLQQRFLPYRPYSALVHVFAAARPLTARIGVIGVQPSDYSPLVEALIQHTTIVGVRHIPNTNQIVVVFGSTPAEADVTKVVGILNAQRFMGVQILPNHESLPLVLNEGNEKTE